MDINCRQSSLGKFSPIRRSSRRFIWPKTSASEFIYAGCNMEYRSWIRSQQVFPLFPGYRN